MQTYQPALDWIGAQQGAMIARTREWAEINSGSYNLAGLAVMSAALQRDFAALGGEMKEIAVDSLSVVNSAGQLEQIPLGKVLSIRKRSDAKRRVFLGGHMDTVFAADHPFQHCKEVDANTLNGPGVADLKGGLAVMLTALLAFEQSPYAGQLGWEILLNPDEEIGSLSSSPLFVEAAKRNDFGLIFEPALADGTLAGARKGSGNFTAIIHGRAAHAGREMHLGRNAIVAMAEFITALDALNHQQAGVTVNAGKVEGGGAVNVVPDLSICRFNVRVANADEKRWAEEKIAALVKSFERRDGISLVLHGGFGRSPKTLSAANEKLFHVLADTGNTLGQPIRWKDTGGVCDGNNLAAAGLPNIDTMGVRGGEIHSEREFVLLDSLTERAKLAALLLMRYANGEFTLKG